jgi:hypothetical protein
MRQASVGGMMFMVEEVRSVTSETHAGGFRVALGEG